MTRTRCPVFRWMKPSLKLPTRILGPHRSASMPMGLPIFSEAFRMATNAFPVSRVVSMAHVEAKDIHTRIP